MSDWTARIDALLADRPRVEDYEGAEYECTFDWDYPAWLEECLALAAERMREPHGHNCRALWSLTAPDCTCGKDSDLLRILEGK